MTDQSTPRMTCFRATANESLHKDARCSTEVRGTEGIERGRGGTEGSQGRTAHLIVVLLQVIDRHSSETHQGPLGLAADSKFGGADSIEARGAKNRADQGSVDAQGEGHKPSAPHHHLGID